MSMRKARKAQTVDVTKQAQKAQTVDVTKSKQAEKAQTADISKQDQATLEKSKLEPKSKIPNNTKIDKIQIPVRLDDDLLQTIDDYVRDRKRTERGYSRSQFFAEAAEKLLANTKL